MWAFVMVDNEDDWDKSTQMPESWESFISELQMAVDIVLSGGESQPLGKEQRDGFFGQCQLLCEGEHQSAGRGWKKAAAPKSEK